MRSIISVCFMLICLTLSSCAELPESNLNPNHPPIITIKLYSVAPIIINKVTSQSIDGTTKVVLENYMLSANRKTIHVPIGKLTINWDYQCLNGKQKNNNSVTTMISYRNKRISFHSPRVDNSERCSGKPGIRLYNSW